MEKHMAPATNCNFLAMYLRDHIRNGQYSNMKLCQIVKVELGYDVCSSTMNRVLHKARETYLQDDITGFKLLKAYEMKINEMGGHALLEVSSLAKNKFQFVRFFCSIKYQREYASFVKYICLDAAHLKGVNKGVIMIASTLDPNGNVILLAQGITAKENNANWNSFYVQPPYGRIYKY
jgi:hypothetical protein